MKTDMELRQERDAHRKAARKVSKLLRQRSRQAHGLGPRKKGMGCRIGDRDEAEKVRRGWLEAGSYVRRDGSEKLVGRDWRMRVGELERRSGMRCEHMLPLSGRCYMSARDPDHIVKRSIRRDDRLSNLQHLCAMHHDMKHPEFKTQWSKK